MLRILFFQAAQPRGQRAAPDPHPAARQPHRRRAGSLSAPAVERGPGHPQRGGHLLDRQQRVIRGSGCSVRGGGGPAGSGWRSRALPVRGSATTDAPLRPPRQVRPPPGRPRRTAAWGCGKREWRKGPRWRGRVAWSCWRGRPAGPGAGSRTVADGTLPPDAGLQSGLASRPGPQASPRTSPRQVKPAPPQAGTGLTPGPEPRAGTARCPPRTNKGTAPGTGRLWAGHHEGGTVARTRAVRATVAPAPCDGGQPDEGMSACTQRAAPLQGSVMAGWPRVSPFCPLLQKSDFRGLFSRAPGNRLGRDRDTRIVEAR